MRLVAALCLFAISLPLAAGAEKVARGFTQPSCVDGMSKSASINIRFNGEEKTMAAARSALESQQKSIETEIQKIGGKDTQVGSYNYDISADMRYNNNVQSVTYRFSGNVNFRVTSEEIAKKICDRLAEMKQQFSLNVNANRCDN